MSNNILRFEDTPTTADWSLVTLYKKNQKGDKVLVWSISFCEQMATLTMRHGAIGDTITPNTTKVKTNNSGRSLQEQALLDARDRYRKKTYLGYTTDPSGVVKIFLPQLANSWFFDGHRYKPRALSEKIISEGCVMAQTKYDGMRAIATAPANVVTRRGRFIPWLAHIKAQLTILFKYLPQGTVVDGELMGPVGVSRQVLNSMVRSCTTQHPDNDKIMYRVFDISVPDVVGDNAPKATPGATLDIRMATFTAAYERYVSDPVCVAGIIVPVPYIAVTSMTHLRKLFDDTKAAGDEGLVIRFLPGNKPSTIKQSLYKGSRNNNMIKIKDQEDDEAEIIAVHEGTGTDEGTAIFELKMPEGIVFRCRPVGEREERLYWFEHPEECIGELYTYSYRGLSDTGVPQHITGVGFRSD